MVIRTCESFINIIYCKYMSIENCRVIQFVKHEVNEGESK